MQPRPESQDRYVRHLILFIALLGLSSCTHEIAISQFCGGEFTYFHRADNRVQPNTFMIHAAANVDQGYSGRAVPLSGGTSPSYGIFISGKLTDPYNPGYIEYSFNEGQTPYRTIGMVPAQSMKAQAPPTLAASPTGDFSYQIPVECCSSAEAGEYVVSLVPETGKFLLVTANTTTITCPYTGTLTISGRLAEPRAGGEIRAYLHGPQKSCILLTVITATGG